MGPTTIGAINRLPEEQKRQYYARGIPPAILERFNIPPDLRDAAGNDLFCMNCPENSSTAEIGLFHQVGFQDPVFYGHITDTVTGQLHILLYVINDPESRRYDVDSLPDGTNTKLGAECRNLPAELAALQAGLAPGQVRRGLRLLGKAIQSFEQFVLDLGHDLYFADPLYYHNAILFEQNGFAYQKGLKLMNRIQAGFSPDGDLRPLLDNSTPFRSPLISNHIRLRSWAIHDGLLGEPFTDVTMYKHIGKPANICTCEDCQW